MRNIPKMSNLEGGEMRYPNIEAERIRNGMSKDEMSQKLGVSRKTLYNWTVSGNIPQKALEKMSELFSVSIDYLLGRTA